jgi:hypothetical protein
VCFLAENPYSVRVLVVHPTDGVHVLSLGGRPLAAWPWGAVQDVEVAPVMFMGRPRTGLLVKVLGDWHRLVLPGPFDVTRPPALANRVRDAIRVKASAS